MKHNDGAKCRKVSFVLQDLLMMMMMMMIMMIAVVR